MELLVFGGFLFGSGVKQLLLQPHFYVLLVARSSLVDRALVEEHLLEFLFIRPVGRILGYYEGEELNERLIWHFRSARTHQFLFLSHTQFSFWHLFFLLLQTFYFAI